MPRGPHKHAIVYYSRDGHTDRLAVQLADALGADSFRIEAARYGGRVFGYLIAGFDSITGRLPNVSTVPDLAQYTSVSLGAPIWTSYPATPLRAYLAARPQLPDIVGMFFTSGGPAAPEKAFSMVRDAIRDPFDATLSVPNSLDKAATDKRIAAYCDAITSASRTVRAP